MACITGRSLRSSDSQASRPSPFSAKTLSITMDPDRSWPSCTAASDTSGSTALRSAWREITKCIGSPLALAARTYSVASTSIMPERVIRISSGMA